MEDLGPRSKLIGSSVCVEQITATQLGCQQRVCREWDLYYKDGLIYGVRLGPRFSF